jgi:PAS domain S-box-containing protein
MRSASIDKKLQESEKLYHMLFDHSMDGIILTDPRDGGKILSANPAACQMLGWTEEELVGKGRDIMLDLRDTALSALLDERARSGSAKAQLTYRRKDGTTFPGEVSTTFFFDNNGEPQTVTIIRDISERKQVQEALIQSECHYQLLYETMLQGVVYQDASGKIISMNPAAERILGKTPAEFLGSSSVGEEYHTIREDCSIFPGLEHPAMVSLQTGCEVKNVVMGVYNPRENCYRWINISAIPIFRTGEDNPFQVYTLFDDITERKEAEAKLKGTFDNLEKLVKERTAELEKAYNSLKESERSLSEAQKLAHLGNWNRNMITGDVYWSDEVYRIFGFKPHEFDITYDIFFSFVHPDDKDYVSKAVKQTLQGNPFGIDYRIVLADGKERIVHEEVEVVFDEKNIPVQMRGTVQDITERKKTEKTLANLETARKKEIHHRIKNNLQVISSLLDLQAQQLKNRVCINDSDVMEAFRESQNRIICMALIHEELHKDEGFETLNFSQYIKGLAKNLLQTYRVGNADISLKVDLEENTFFDIEFLFRWV